MLRFSLLDHIKYRSVKLFLMLLNLLTIFLFSNRIRRKIRKYKESIYLTKLSKCDLNNWFPTTFPGIEDGKRLKYKTSASSSFSLYYTKPDTFIVSYKAEEIILFSKHFPKDPRIKKILESLKEKQTN